MNRTLVTGQLLILLAVLLSHAAAARNVEQRLQDSAVSVSVLRTCDLEELGLSDIEGVAQIPLPAGMPEGCIFGFPAGQQPGELALRGFELNPQFGREASLSGINIYRDPRCFSAQQSGTEVAQWTAELALQVASGQIAERVGLLLRQEPPSTPEALLAGEVLDWRLEDAQGPPFLVLPQGDVTLVGKPGPGTLELINDAADASTVLVAADETVTVEAIDECTTLTTTVVRTGGGGATVVGTPGGTEAPEVPEQPFIFPPVNPPFFPPEEEDEEEEPLYCTVRDGKIYTPVTREFLDLEEGQKPPLAKHHPALAGKGVQLKSGRIVDHALDLQVPAIGFDFVLDRTYAGHMTTAQGGNLGHRWQLGIDRRLTVVGHEAEEDGLKVERLRGPSVITRANGSGRLDEFKAISKEIHRVQNFGAARPFWAHITTYESPPGEFLEIQRYIVLQHNDLGVRPNPEQHPFKDHANVDSLHGEAIFYVVRFPEHTQEIYNCRGQLIHQIDRYEHRQTLVYQGDINPLTHNRTLTQLTDANAREFRFEADQSYACAPFSTHYDGRLVSDACAAIPLFTAVEDPWARRVEFGYDPAETQLNRITRVMGSHTLTSGYGYTNSGEAKHLLASAYQPKFGPQQNYVENQYADGRVVRQTLGGDSTGFSYGEDWARVQDPNSNVTRYTLTETAAGIAASEVTLEGAEDVLRTTRYRHNADGQVLSVTHPRGNVTDYEYFGNGGPVVIPDARMQNLLDVQITYRNALTRGLIKSVTQRSHLPDDDIQTATTRYTYEPLYSQLLTSTDPRGNTTHYEYVYNQRGSDGQAVKVLLPTRTLVDGTQQTDLAVRYAFDSHGNQIRSTDVDNQTISYRYDAIGALTGVEYPLGMREVYERDERGNLIAAVQANGVALTYEVDLRDLTLSAVTDPDGYKIESTYEYDKNFNRTLAATEIKDVFRSSGSVKASKSVTYREKSTEYDLLNRPKVETIRGGSRALRTTFDYDGNGNLTETILPSSNGEPLVVRYEYNGANERTSTRAASTSEDRTYDANGNLLSVKDARGDASTYRYNGLDFMVEETTPLESVVSLGLDAVGNVLSRIVEGFTGLADGSRATLQRIELTYDEFNQPLDKREYTLQGNANQRTTWLYDKLGYISAEATRGVGTTRYERDALGRETRVIDPVGNEVLLEYDAQGRVRTRTDRVREYGDGGSNAQRKRIWKNYVTTFAYDALGNLRSQRQGMLTTLHYWNSAGDLRTRTQLVGGQVVDQDDMQYDSFGRVTRTRGRRGTVEIAYTDSGQVRSVTTPQGVTDRQYDVLGRLTSLKTPDGAVVATTFDEVGNPVRVVDANGRATENLYGPQGLLELSESGTDIERFRHDGLGRLVYAATGATEHIQVERSFDGLDRLTQDVQIVHGDRYAVNQSFSVTASVGDGNGIQHTRIRNLSLPKVLGGATLEYYLDGLDRVTSASLGTDEPTATYYYAGRNRLAGRSLGRYGTEYRYDDDRRIKTLLVHDTTANRVVSRYEQGYEGLRNTRAVSSHFTGAQSAPYRLEEQVFQYDAAGRITESRTALTTRGSPNAVPLHRTAVERKVYDNAGQLASVSSSLATVRKEGFFLPENITRVDEVRLDKFLRPNKGGQIQQVHSTVLKANRPVSGDVSIPHNEVEIMVDQAASYPGYQQKQVLEHDKSGNLIEDDQYRYDYDFRNRLIRVTDKLTTSGRLQIQSTQYDPLGRPVQKTFELRHISRAVWRRQDLRFVYWENQVVGELSRDNPSANAWQHLATYYPGGIAGEVLRMDRRRNDALAADLVKYYPIEGVNGDIASVAEGYDTPQPIHLKPHFTGTDGATENMRQERVIAGTETRLPILARGVRYDSFLRMQFPEGSGSVAYDYRSAPGLELERYNSENLADIIALIEEHHPKPGIVRVLEYYVAGATLGIVGYMAVPAAQGLTIMGINGAASAAVDTGLRATFGHELSARGLGESFAMGAIAGGLGSVATTVATGSGASVMREFAIGVGVDTTIGTAMDVAGGADFSKALVSNALTSVATGALTNTLIETAFSKPDSVVRTQQIASAHSPQAFVHPGMGPMQPIMGAVDNASFGSFAAIAPLLGQLADRMPVARSLIQEWRGNELALMPQGVAPGANFLDRVAAYFSHSSLAAQTILAFDPEVSVPSMNNGVVQSRLVFGMHQKRLGQSPGQILVINPKMSPGMQVVTLLHEYAHARGAFELQAFHITYEAIYRLSLKQSGLPATEAALIGTAHRYMNAYMQAQGQKGRMRVRDDLAATLRRDYKQFWEVGRTPKQLRSKIELETNPAYWVDGLGAFN